MMNETFLLWLLPFGLCIVFITSLTIWLSVKRTCTAKMNGSRTHPVTTLIIMGSGGHTAEMLRLLRGLGSAYGPRHYIVAATDDSSAEKIIEHETWRNNHNLANRDYKIHEVPRSREVRQSYLSSIVTTLFACFKSLPLVYNIQPRLIICNGPGTCIPLCFAGILLNLLRLGEVKVVYVESICRVTSLSLSGRLCYYLVGDVFVQWRELQTRYTRTKYIGRLV